MNQLLRKAAVHEASHAVGFLAGGVAVEELEIGADGSGMCQTATPDTKIAPELLALTSLAGAVGESVFLGDEGPMSGPDLDHLESGTGDLGRTCRVLREQAVSQAHSFCYLHGAEISYLAEHLLSRRVLHASDLARFATLYAATHAVASPKRRPRLSDPEYQTSARRKVIGPVSVPSGCGFLG